MCPDYFVTDVPDRSMSKFEARFKNDKRGAGLPACRAAQDCAAGLQQGIVSSRRIETACRKNVVCDTFSLNRPWGSGIIEPLPRSRRVRFLGEGMARGLYTCLVWGSPTVISADAIRSAG